MTGASKQTLVGNMEIRMRQQDQRWSRRKQSGEESFFTKFVLRKRNKVAIPGQVVEQIGSKWGQTFE